MNIVPIKCQRDYRRKLKEIEGLMAAKRNTREGDLLDILVTLVEAWERKIIRLIFPTHLRRSRYQMGHNGFSRGISFLS